MPNRELSGLALGTAIADADLFYSVQSSLSVRQPGTALAAYLATKIPADIINVGSYASIMSDGVTDNLTAFDVFTRAVRGLTGARSFPVTVTITIATPAVISWTSHGLRVNEAVVFQTTGALPTGITAGTTYYVISAGLTSDSFEISTKNVFPDYTGEGSAINTSGSQSGVHSARVFGTLWQNVLLPPGAYYGSTIMSLTGFLRKFRLLAYGAATHNLQFGPRGFLTDNSGGLTVYAFMATAEKDNTTITLITAANTSLFHINQWVCLGALDLQNSFGTQTSFPPNCQFFEFRQIATINAGTGVITLTEKLRNTYRSTFPKFFDSARDGGFGSGGGPATIFGMNDEWNMEIEVRGLRLDATGSETISSARDFKLIDCSIGDQGPVPSVSKSWTMTNCEFDYNVAIEVDKLVELVRFSDCRFNGVNGGMTFQSPTPDRALLEGCFIGSVAGTPKNIEINNCDIQTLTIGPLSCGSTESITLLNSRISSFDRTFRLDDQPAISAFNNLVSNYTFSNGTLKQPIATTTANAWAVPGRSMYINDMTQNFYSMGAPFQILSVYMDGSNNFCMDTTLAAVPVGNSTTSTVTITVATPAVISWTTHGLAAGTPVTFKTTGALPTGLSVSVLYYVLAAGLAANTFEVSTSISGAAVNTSGTQSGTHTAIANPLHFAVHACPRVTVRNCTGCSEIVDASNGPDNVPLFSYAKRRLVGDIGTSFAQQFYRPMRCAGNLVSLKVNVLRAYSGVAGTMTLTITEQAFDSSLVESDLSQIINLKTVGLRTITPAGVTGTQSGDTIVATSVWLSGNGTKLAYTSGVESFQVAPLVEIELITDQGVNDPAIIVVLDSQNAHQIQIDDTTSTGTGT